MKSMKEDPPELGEKSPDPRARVCVLVNGSHFENLLKPLRSRVMMHDCKWTFVVDKWI